MRYFLDTNIMSDLVWRPRGRVAQQIAKVGSENVLTSIIVVAEMRYGAAKKNAVALSRQIDTVLSTIHIAAFEPPADVTYGDLRAALERKGQLIGANDLLIAAQCLSLQCTLVTANEREFSRVPALLLENWLR